MEEGEISETESVYEEEYAQYSILPAEAPPANASLLEMTGEQYLGWVQQERLRLPRVKAIAAETKAAQQRLCASQEMYSEWNVQYDPIIEQFKQVCSQLSLAEESVYQSVVALRDAPVASVLMSLSEAQCLNLLYRMQSEEYDEAWPYYLMCRLAAPPHHPSAISALRQVCRSDIRLKVIMAGVFGQLDLIKDL